MDTEAKRTRRIQNDKIALRRVNRLLPSLQAKMADEGKGRPTLRRREPWGGRPRATLCYTNTERALRKDTYGVKDHRLCDKTWGASNRTSRRPTFQGHARTKAKRLGRQHDGEERGKMGANRGGGRIPPHCLVRGVSTAVREQLQTANTPPSMKPPKGLAKPRQRQRSNRPKKNRSTGGVGLAMGDDQFTGEIPSI